MTLLPGTKGKLRRGYLIGSLRKKGKKRESFPGGRNQKVRGYERQCIP